jgi:hypothetical protein
MLLRGIPFGKASGKTQWNEEKKGPAVAIIII